MSVGLASGFLLEDGMKRRSRPALAATIELGAYESVEEKTRRAGLTRGRSPSQAQRQAALDSGSGI